MHESAYHVMDQQLETLKLPFARVLDVGAFDVNGTLRPLVQGRGWHYTGLDIRAGANVDVVAADPYHFPLPDDGDFDVVMCACMLHNAERPWQLLPEMARVLKPGGLLLIHTVWNWPLNPHPIDCFRVMPDGMQVLFDLCGILENYYINRENANDLIGRAWKQQTQSSIVSPSSARSAAKPKSKRSPQ